MTSIIGLEYKLVTNLFFLLISSSSTNEWSLTRTVAVRMSVMSNAAAGLVGLWTFIANERLSCVVMLTQ